jgi:hypothetical protein
MKKSIKIIVAIATLIGLTFLGAYFELNLFIIFIIDIIFLFSITPKVKNPVMRLKKNKNYNGLPWDPPYEL